MDMNFYNQILIKEFFDIYPESGNEARDTVLEIDQQNFIFNLDGHRGNNFQNNIDLLYAGCSLTFGAGLPQDAIWGEILAKKLNIDVNNLSYKGGSIIHIVNNIFNYINKYGDPKKILCCFPSLDRIRWFDDNIVTISEDTLGRFCDYQQLVWLNNKDNKYIKLPVRADNIIHGQSARYFSIFAIKMLENYCNAKNIYFKWTSWAPESIFDLLKFNNKINFINSNIKIVYKDDKWILVDEFDKEINCHSEYKNEIFYKGTDGNQGWPHMGKHIHLHIAEAFEKEIKNDNSWN